MPAYRHKMCCAYAEPPPPRVRKPRKPRSQLTEEEKLEAEVKRVVNKGLREAKKEWEATLKPWAPIEGFSWPKDTIAMYKSDAKTAFGLTEKEILTIPHESIQASPKTFFSYRDVHDLAIRKFNAGACKFEVDYPGQVVSRSGGARIFVKYDHNLRRRTRKNWMDMGEYHPHHIAEMIRERNEPSKNVSVPLKKE